MNIDDLDIDNMHHAYLIEGEDVEALIGSLEDIFDISFVGNPNVLIKQVNIFNVQDSRDVVAFVVGASLGVGAKKIILIKTNSLNKESQNILLKTLEEPSKGTYIFILTPNTDILLDTVLSRCLRVDLPVDIDKQEIINKEAKDFINTDASGRLKILEKINKGKDKNENKIRMIKILDAVELFLDNNKDLPDWELGVRATIQAKEYIRDKGAMSKMLMESVALVL